MKMTQVQTYSVSVADITLLGGDTVRCSVKVPVGSRHNERVFVEYICDRTHSIDVDLDFIQITLILYEVVQRRFLKPFSRIVVPNEHMVGICNALNMHYFPTTQVVGMGTFTVDGSVKDAVVEYLVCNPV